MQQAIDDKRGFAVLVKIPELPRPEKIINSAENIPGKYEYYENNYNDDLQLKANNNISIVAWDIDD